MKKNHTTSIFLDSYPVQGHMKAGVPTAYPLYSQRVATVDRSTCFDLAHVYAGCLPDARLKRLMSKSQQKNLSIN